MWPLILAGASVAAWAAWSSKSKAERTKVIQDEILEQVTLGNGQYDWYPLVGYDGVEVTRDALMVNDLRVPVNAKTMAGICAILSNREPAGYRIVPTTALVEDIIHEQATTRLIPPTFNPALSSDPYYIMSDETVTKFNNRLNQQILPGTSALLSCVGKSWILDNLAIAHPGRAINYGLFRPDGPTKSITRKFRLWQDPGWLHDMNHWDYSQTCRLVRLAPGASVPCHERLRAFKLWY